MIFSLFILVLNHLLIYGSAQLSDNGIGWWDTISSHIPLWYTEETGIFDDNDQEIKNSVKLIELFPTLKEKLESSNEKEREEAKEFIEKMNTQIKEKKRYTNILWKGVQTIIDMGRLESNERRSNEKQVNIFWQIIQGFINFFKRILGMKIDDDEKHEHDDKKNKHEKSSKSTKDEESKDQKDVHLSTHHSAPSTDLKAGLKDDLDCFEENSGEFIHGDKKHKKYTPSEEEHPQSSDPKLGTKGTLDFFDSSKPVEFVH